MTIGNSIRRSNQVPHVTYPDGDTADIIETILYADGKSAADTRGFVTRIEGANTTDTCYNIWKFLKQNIQYRRDAPGYERVQSPAALWASKSGDCKSYSVFIGSCLQNLGIPYVYRFTKYAGQTDWTHVYVVAKPEGQRPIIIDAVHSRFNDEVAYKSKKDIAPATVTGIGAITINADIDDLLTWAANGIIVGAFSWMAGRLLTKYVKF